MFNQSYAAFLGLAFACCVWASAQEGGVSLRQAQDAAHVFVESAAKDWQQSFVANLDGLAME
jgi:hypothetical protein